MKFPTTPGTTFKFTASSATEAAQLLREQLGGDASVLSVRQVGRSGLLGVFSAPRLEVVARVGAAAAPVDGGAWTGDGSDPGGDRPVHPSSAGATAPRPRPAAHTLEDLLVRSGFSPAVIDRLRASPGWAALREEPLHRALVKTGRYLTGLATFARPDPAPLARAAFIGAPGVGRTTALCKWVAAEVFRRARLGHVVTAEFDRPNPAGPLPVFCEALGVPLAHFPASTRPATPGGFVCIDLPGMSVRRPAENTALRGFLDREEIAGRILVLNAAYDTAVLGAARNAGRDLGATHVVFTHLDEVSQWGRLWDHLLEDDLTPLFLSTGPSLTGEMEPDAVDAVARRTFPALDEQGGQWTVDGGQKPIGDHLDQHDAEEAELPAGFAAATGLRHRPAIQRQPPTAAAI
jgi:flagellar biosynthesis protein FlhF